MNKKFYTYQRHDNPNCGYGMTGEIIFGGEDGRELLFTPDDATRSFQVSAKDIFGLGKNWQEKLTIIIQARLQ
jgi:hypothetical protein